MAQQRLKADQLHSVGVLAFPGAPPTNDVGSAAVDLVYQAADFLREMQVRARQTETRAQSLCKAASEKVRAAEMRAQTSERAYRDLLAAVDQKLQEVSWALQQAQADCNAEIEKRTAAELHVEISRAEAREAKRALLAVEEAIRKKLITPHSATRETLAAVA